MDWETLLGLTGLYILLIANLVYHWLTAKRLIEANTSNNKLLESNERILNLIGGILAEAAEERRGGAEKKEDAEEIIEEDTPKPHDEEYKIKFNLPDRW